MFPVTSCNLKYRPKLKIYSNSTGTCTFDPESEDARSYGWWQFVRRIKGLLVFNDHSYSHSTSAHQSSVRKLLKELGLKIDLEVDVRAGLQAFESSALEPLYRLVFINEIIMARKGVRETTKQTCLAEIETAKANIATARALGAKFSKAEQAALRKDMLEQESKRIEVARAERASDSEYRREANAMLKSDEFQIII